MDGEKPVVGKIYDGMYMIGKAFVDCTAPWREQALAIHMKRWDYLHSDFHAAAYALDTEFLDTDGDTDKVTISLPKCTHPSLLLRIFLRVLCARVGVCSRAVHAGRRHQDDREAHLSQDASGGSQTKANPDGGHGERRLGDAACPGRGRHRYAGVWQLYRAREGIFTKSSVTWWATHVKHLPHFSKIA
eukprot:1163783-Pleurochrysis_carterae.AAC.4